MFTTVIVSKMDNVNYCDDYSHDIIVLIVTWNFHYCPILLLVEYERMKLV